jgi:hypothetical protein
MPLDNVMLYAINASAESLMYEMLFRLKHVGSALQHQSIAR